MSTEILLYALLGFSVVNSLVGARFSVAIRGAVKTKIGTPALVYLSLAGLASAALWVLLAIATGYWQFAAMSLAQFLVSQAANIGSKGATK